MTEGTGVVVGQGLNVFPAGLRGKAAELLMDAKEHPPADLAETVDQETQDHGVDIPFDPVTLEFTIDGTEYELREPVLAQEIQLIQLLRKTDMDVGTLDLDIVDLVTNPASIVDKLAAGVSVDTLLGVLGAKVPRFFAILLTPKGVRMKDKDLAQVESDLLNGMTLTNQGEVMTAFFAYVPKLAAGIAQRLKDQERTLKATAEAKLKAGAATGGSGASGGASSGPKPV